MNISIRLIIRGMAIVKSEVLEDTMDKIMPDNK